MCFIQKTGIRLLIPQQNYQEALNFAIHLSKALFYVFSTNSEIIHIQSFAHKSYNHIFFGRHYRYFRLMQIGEFSKFNKRTSLYQKQLLQDFNM
jgi:hypothetical protein